MLSDGLFLAACVVPPVCLVVVIAWTLVVLRRFRRTAASAPSPPHSLAQFRPSQPVFVPPPPPPFLHPPPFPSPSEQPIPRDQLFSVLPPAQPTPAEPPFSIHTTLPRSGTRVLARNASSNQSHTPSSNSHSGSEAAWKRLSGVSRERTRRDKPERTRREKGKFGVGDADDEWVAVVPTPTATSAGHDGGIETRSIVDETLRPAGRSRRRTSTWSAQDFDPLVSPSSKRHSASASLSAPNTIARPGPRPLPPGAGYGASAWSAATSAVDLPTSSALTTPDEVMVGGSQESGMPLMRQTSSKEAHSPMSPSTPAHPVPASDTLQYDPHHTPDVTETLRLSRIYPDHEQSPSPDDYTISARSSAYFGTTVLPMPTRTPSPTAIFPNTPTRLSMRDCDSSAFSSPVSPSAPRYFPHSAPPSHAHTRVSHISTATSAALADLETYAASLSSSFAFPAKPAAHSASPSEPPLTAFPTRTSSRRQGSIPWFAADTPAQAVEQDPARDSEEHEVFRRASRPISWLPRQGSSGTLPDGVPQLTDLAVTNPDTVSAKASVDLP
ncbi:hypothetical protein NBRC10512_001086 [Rhodotorula toruloides]|uniref:RHTO0S06e11100g1_1 n=2 Tax=Rhodotorula toruloides TaxID=5286 RepID=A0A061B5C5_RHOTO|nr:uncharacterized protein RHTO_04393 [Rhodotorula toruloides NP11]EMS19392.1 hypothetical protein RHTO_04393 [Rhodotorula toruloides NP11]CDR42218.1 RHTO0S06e11100g1_1 [Rhodotorula toruloides]